MPAKRMQPTSFTDFNPLDVLAAAASQSARIDGKDEDCETCSDSVTTMPDDMDSNEKDIEGDVDKEAVPTEHTFALPHSPGKTNSNIVKVKTVQVPDSNRKIIAVGVQEADNKDIGPLLNQKSSTSVLRIHLPSSAPDHSYAFGSQLANLRAEDDEGYSSRSSIDEDAEDSAFHLVPHRPRTPGSEGLLSPAGSDLSSPGLNPDTNTLPSPTSPEKGKKSSRILFVSKDADLKTLLKADSKVLVNNATPNVLRTLLGKKAESLHENGGNGSILKTVISDDKLEAPESLTQVLTVTKGNPNLDISDSGLPLISETALPEKKVNEDNSDIVDVLEEKSEDVGESSCDDGKEETNACDDKSTRSEGSMSLCNDEFAERAPLIPDTCSPLQDDMSPQEDQGTTNTDGTETSQLPASLSCDNLELLSNGKETVSVETKVEDEASSNDGHSIEDDDKKSQSEQTVPGDSETVTKDSLVKLDQTLDNNELEELDTKVDELVSSQDECSKVVSKNNNDLFQLSRNQYIIEDEESPFSKFISSSPSPDGDTEPSDSKQGEMKSYSLAAIGPNFIKCQSQSKSGGNVVHVIPVVGNAGKAPSSSRGTSKSMQYVAASQTKGSNVHDAKVPVLVPASLVKTGILPPSAVLKVPAQTSPSMLSAELNKIAMKREKELSNSQSLLADRTDSSDQTASIGTVGSLSSWKKQKRVQSPGLFKLGGTSSSMEFIRIQGSQIQTNMDSDQDKFSLISDKSEIPGHNPWLSTPTTPMSTSSRDSYDTFSPSLHASSDDSNLSPSISSPPPSRKRRRPNLSAPKLKDAEWQSSELHPLIDHDYCMFTEFNAQIQSSIIATTETKTKTERRYNKKVKAGKAAEAELPVVEKLPRGRPPASHKGLLKNKRGRKKKDTVKVTADEIKAKALLKLENKKLKEELEVKRRERKQLRNEKKALAEKKQKERTKKNYVKITGSYQDDFVYFATSHRKKKRQAPEQPTELQPAVQKPPVSRGLNVFDWYKNLAQADKSCFSTPSGGLPETTLSLSTSTVASTGFSTGITSSSSLTVPSSKSLNATTPTHESEVVDLVCELSNIPASAEETSISSESQQVAGEGNLDLMAEEVRNLLNSMSENDLKLLEKAAEPTVSTAADAGLDGFLTSFTPDGGPTLTQGANSSPTQLCDLDEINDNDLLPTDIASQMNNILGDLGTHAGAASSASSGIVQSGPITSQVPFPGERLDKNELFPDISANAVTSNVSAPPESAVPELCVVSMFWNDLPGLIMNSKQYVRLVDIHKQVLPAKDTGILKKRCQMMGLEIAQCSEMQRDFLIRYANANKSKSTVIVEKQAAEELIGFYVNPKPRSGTSSSESTVPGEPSTLLSRPADSGAKVKGSTEVNLTCESSSHESSAGSSQMEENSPEGTLTSTSPASRTLNKGSNPTLDGSTYQITTPQPRSDLSVRNVKRKSRSIGSSDETSPLDVKRSERHRNKKVNYADMVNGTHMFDIEATQESPNGDLRAKESSLQRKVESASPSCLSESDDIVVDTASSSAAENEEPSVMEGPEEVQIRRLKAKADRRKLSKKDKRKLRRLNDKLERRETKRRLANLKKARLLTGKAKLLNKSNAKDALHLKNGIRQAKKLDIHAVKEASWPPAELKQSVLAVVHKDNVQRSQRGGSTQEGFLHIGKLINPNALCVQCATCDDFFAMRRFLKHLHHAGLADELREVTQPQQLVLRGPEPSHDNQKLFDRVQKKLASWQNKDIPKEMRNPLAMRKKEFIKREKPLPTLKEKSKLSSIMDVNHERQDTVQAPVPIQVKPEGSLVTLKSELAAAPLGNSSVEIKQEAVEADVALKLDEVKAETVEDSSVRHSRRARKTKQLHPMEMYVYTKRDTPNELTPQPPAKRPRRDNEDPKKPRGIPIKNPTQRLPKGWSYV